MIDIMKSNNIADLGRIKKIVTSLYELYLEQAGQDYSCFESYHENEHDNSGGDPDYHNDSHDNTLDRMVMKRMVKNASN